MAKSKEKKPFHASEWPSYFTPGFLKNHVASPTNAKKRAFDIFLARIKEHKEGIKRIEDELAKAIKIAHDAKAMPDLKKGDSKNLDEDKIDKQIKLLEDHQKEIEKMLIKAVGTKDEKEFKKADKEFVKKIKTIKELRSGLSRRKDAKAGLVNTLLSVSKGDLIDIAQKLHRDAQDGKIKKNDKFTMSRTFTYWDLGGSHDNLKKKPAPREGKLDARIHEHKGRLVLGHLAGMK